MDTKTREEYNQMTEDERKQEFADFLRIKYREYEDQKRRRVSQNEWASSYLGVKPGSLSTWMQAYTLPSDENAHKLFARYGNIVFDILGTPRRISDNPRIQRLNEIYPTLSEEERKEIDVIIDRHKEGDSTEVAHAQAQ